MGPRFPSPGLSPSLTPGPDVVIGVHCPQLAGLAVMAVGIWTLALKSDYISLLASGTYLATAYILVVAGIVVMVTGVLGCCATFKERRNLLRLVSRARLAWGWGRGWGTLGDRVPAGGGWGACQAAWGWLWVPDRAGRECWALLGLSLPTCPALHVPTSPLCQPREGTRESMGACWSLA